MTIIRPKILILGHARHGKDTVGEWFAQKGYKFISSSRFVGEKVVWPAMCKSNEDAIKDNKALPFPYKDFEEAFTNRLLDRESWYSMIAAYNTPDRSRLGRELLAEYDLYVGLRNHRELHALKLHQAYNIAIWVDASERCPPEPSSSCTVASWMADVVVDNNGTLDDLDKQLVVLYDNLIRPLEYIQPEPNFPRFTIASS